MYVCVRERVRKREGGREGETVFFYFFLSFPFCAFCDVTSNQLKQVPKNKRHTNLHIWQTSSKWLYVECDLSEFFFFFFSFFFLVLQIGLEAYDFLKFTLNQFILLCLLCCCCLSFFRCNLHISVRARDIVWLGGDIQCLFLGHFLMVESVQPEDDCDGPSSSSSFDTWLVYK